MSRIAEEAVAKVTGQARFTSDLYLPKMARARVLSSPYAHAKILSIDTSKAKALPGVLAVVTGEDLQVYTGDVIQDQPVLAVGKVRHHGEPVAAVAAVDDATVEEALNLIDVQYEPLPVVADLDAALAPGAPLVHEKLPEGAPEYLQEGSNIVHHCVYTKGSIEQGFAEADEVFEDEFRFPREFHYPMETDCAVASYDSGSITIWGVSQGPFSVQENIAKAFKVPVAKVQSLGSYLGSGFGGRSGHYPVLAVALAKAAGVPIRLTYSVAENMASVRRHNLRARLKTGVKRDGTIVARQLEAWYDIGAYSRRSPWIAEMAVARFLAAYRVPNVQVDAYCVFTNTPSCATYRSPGAESVGWARETQFNIIARRMGLDPVEFRLRNLLSRGEEGPLTGTRPQDTDLPGDMQKLAAAGGWKDPARPGRGRGVAAVCHAASAGPPSSAIVRLRTDGSLMVICSGVEMGQGLYTVMRTIAAWELGVPLDKVFVNPVVDTFATPYDTGTGGSRGTVVTGLAVQMATRDVKRQVLEAAAKQFEVPVESLQIQDGMVLAGEQSRSVAEVMQRVYTAIIAQPWAPGVVSQLSGPSRSAHPQGRGELIGSATITPGFDNGRLDLKPTFWETGMGMAEVEVERETGQVRIVRYTALGDPGKVLDQQTAMGQIEGASTQALGHTLGEEMRFDADGQLLNSTLMEYRVTQIEDVPEQFRAVLVENEDGVGAFGSRGMGQVHLSCMAPAVTSAIGQLTGVYIHELPISPQRLWEALHPLTNGQTASRSRRRQLGRAAGAAGPDGGEAVV